MNNYWWLLVPAIFLAIFSDKIDEAVKADEKLKKSNTCYLCRSGFDYTY